MLPTRCLNDMTRTLLLAFCSANLAFVSFQACAQDTIPADTLRALKRATVFIRVDAGRESGTGSGFLIGKQKNNAYVITNEHVVRQRGQTQRKVNVDFFSGTKERKSYPAAVLSEDKFRDLAVLRIENKELPEPIKLKGKQTIRETLPVYILGFPFGEALSTSRLGPNVTIGKGSISSIRNDDFGNLEQVQVDGDINPGNSGGPIVFNDGSLMGVSVKTVLGTQIGIGIPGDSVVDMLFGRIGALGISQKPADSKQVDCALTAELIDPLEKIKNIHFLYVDEKRLDKSSLKMPQDGKWSRVSTRMRQVKLNIDGQSANAKFSIKGKEGEKITVVHQVRYVDGRGDTYYTSPAKYRINFPDAVVNKAADDERRITKTRPPAQPKMREKEDGWLGKSAPTKEANPPASKKEEPADKDGWLGTDKSKSSKIATAPVSSEKPLAGNKFTVVDAECQVINFDSKDTVPDLVWDSDSKHFYVLSNKGLLRKISFPGLVETCTIDFASKCSTIQMSKEGLCVAVTGLQDLVIVDPETLKPKKSIPIGEAKHFATAPATSIAFIPGNGRLHLIDLRTGRHVSSYSPQDFRSNNGHVHGFEMPTLTPDGKHLFCISLQTLQHFNVRGRSLSYDGQGSARGSNTKRIEVSGDSKYVAMPSGGGNGKGYSTYIYSVNDVKNKILEIESGAYPRTIAYDKAAGMIYAQNHGHELITFSGKGLSVKSYDLGRVASDTARMLVHPSGKRVILLTQPNMVVVNLPN